jgi:hypothetical protein
VTAGPFEPLSQKRGVAELVIVALGKGEREHCYEEAGNFRRDSRKMSPECIKAKAKYPYRRDQGKNYQREWTQKLA